MASISRGRVVVRSQPVPPKITGISGYLFSQAEAFARFFVKITDTYTLSGFLILNPTVSPCALCHAEIFISARFGILLSKSTKDILIGLIPCSIFLPSCYSIPDMESERISCIRIYSLGCRHTNPMMCLSPMHIHNNLHPGLLPIEGVCSNS